MRGNVYPELIDADIFATSATSAWITTHLFLTLAWTKEQNTAGARSDPLDRSTDREADSHHAENYSCTFSSMRIKCSSTGQDIPGIKGIITLGRLFCTRLSSMRHCGQTEKEIQFRTSTNSEEFKSPPQITAPSKSELFQRTKNHHFISVRG